jgi:hypothetical protein
MIDFIPRITLTEAMTSPAFFGSVYASPTFWTWRVVAKLIDNIPLIEPREVDLFKECTGRTQLLSTTSKGVLRRYAFLCGRRAGKDRFLSGVAVWRAALCADWRKYLSAGEQAVVLLLGADKRQAAILSKYCRGLIEAKGLQSEVKRATSDVVEFVNGSVLEIATNDPSLVRGRSAIAIIGSEVSHWPSDEYAANRDEEVVGAAAEPSMAMCPDGGLLLLGSTVHRRQGLMYRMYSQLHGNDTTDDICWYAPSKTMNPTLRQAVIEAALANDLHRANAEYLNVFREDSTDCYPTDAIAACTDFNVLERPPRPFISYFAFFDQAFGSGKDSFAIAIAHREGDITIIDAIRERKPRFVPDDVIKEYSALLKSYRVRKVVGDKAADGYRYTWQDNGIYYEPSEHNKTEIYLRFLPIVLAQRVRLIDSPVLRQQLLSLERKVVGGRETVDHPRHINAHDDVSNVCAGVALLADIRAGGFTAADMALANHGADYFKKGLVG